MVGVIDGADAVAKRDHIVDGGKDILLGDMLRHKELKLRLCHILDVSNSLVARYALLVSGSDDVGKNRISYLLTLLNAAVDKVEAENKLGADGAVADKSDNSARLDSNVNGVYKAVFDSIGNVAVDLNACLSDDLAGEGVDNRGSKGEADDPVSEGDLLVELIASNGSKVILLGVEEHSVNEHLCTLNERRLTGTDLFVYLLKCLIAKRGTVLLCEGTALVLRHRDAEDLLVTEHSEYIVVGVSARIKKGADKHGDRNLAVLIDLNVEHACRIGLVLKPCTAVRNYLRGVIMLTCLIDGNVIIHAGRTHELRDDNTLCTVDNEGSVIGHKREITKEDLSRLKLARRLVGKADTHLHVSIVGHRSVLTLLDGISRGRIKGVVGKLDRKIAGSINYRGYVAKHLVESLLEEPFIGVSLHLDKVGHFGSCFNLRKAHSYIGAKRLRFKHHK